MLTNKELKNIVKEKYDKRAKQHAVKNQSSCCKQASSSTCQDVSENYTNEKGYFAEADLHLGCGLPTKFAQIKIADTVVDLGCGAGNDAFIARSIVGEKGYVLGIDMTGSMIEKAYKNAQNLSYKNVDFRLGDIEQLPVDDNFADVVVSNCVMNLVPNKQKAFSETFRILKAGGHFSISDIVLQGDLPHDIRAATSMYVGCIAGAMQKEEYLSTIANAGFTNITVQKERLIEVPDEVFLQYITASEIREYKQRGSGIYSITVYAEKP